MNLSQLGETTRGVWTRAAAIELISAGAVRALLADGSWQVCMPGIYADGGFVLDAEQRAWAAVLASGGSLQPATVAAQVAAAGRTAARVWGLPLIDDDDPATGARETGLDHVHVRGGGRARRTTFGRLRRHDLVLRSGDLRRLPSGLVILSPVRTLVHCASLLTFEALVCATDDALHRGLVTPTELSDAVRCWAGEPGSALLRRAVAAADGRAEAPTETLARLLLLPVLPNLEPQVRLFDARGWPISRFDLGDRVARLAVEADGKRGHAGEQMAAKDQRRDRTSEARGWRTERVRWFELRREQQQLVRRVTQAHAAQMTRHSAAA